jgi:serine/threonine protein kinase
MEQSLTELCVIGRPLSGEQVGNYLLLRELGQGGYAQVYLAEHLSLKQQVALKLLNRSLTQHEDLVRFQFEARLLAQLRHRHIVRALNFDGEGKTPFLAMDYAPGGTIQQVFRHGVPQPLFRMLPFAMQIARALQYAHDHSVIHCDVKPENILLGPSNEAWLADFGIATTIGFILRTPYGRQAIRGTVRYMAPEQIRGTPLPASDQYALAVMVYEWLCGVPPFRGTEVGVCVQHVSAPPPRLREHVPSISPDVERVILKALEKDPWKRFAHVLEFASALKQASLGQVQRLYQA